MAANVHVTCACDPYETEWFALPLTGSQIHRSNAAVTLLYRFARYLQPGLSNTLASLRLADFG